METEVALTQLAMVEAAAQTEDANVAKMLKEAIIKDMLALPTSPLSGHRWRTNVWLSVLCGLAHRAQLGK